LELVGEIVKKCGMLGWARGIKVTFCNFSAKQMGGFLIEDG